MLILDIILNECFHQPSKLQTDLSIAQQAINLVAQSQNKATLSISQSTQSDSAAMKTVAIVTLTFLPATFVSVRTPISSHLISTRTQPANQDGTGLIQHEFLQLHTEYGLETGIVDGVGADVDLLVDHHSVDGGDGGGVVFLAEVAWWEDGKEGGEVVVWLGMRSYLMSYSMLSI